MSLRTRENRVSLASWITAECEAWIPHTNGADEEFRDAVLTAIEMFHACHTSPTDGPVDQAGERIDAIEQFEMPYGKHKGKLIQDVPPRYLARLYKPTDPDWFSQEISWYTQTTQFRRRYAREH